MSGISGASGSTGVISSAANTLPASQPPAESVAALGRHVQGIKNVSPWRASAAPEHCPPVKQQKLETPVADYHRMLRALAEMPFPTQSGTKEEAISFATTRYSNVLDALLRHPGREADPLPPFDRARGIVLGSMRETLIGPASRMERLDAERILTSVEMELLKRRN